MRNINHNTLLRKMVLAVIGLVAAGLVATAHARSADRTSLTFSKDVALPGVVLPAGTYVFDIANPDSSHDVVRVATQDGHVRYMGLTLRVERPAGGPKNQARELGWGGARKPAPHQARVPARARDARPVLYPL